MIYRVKNIFSVGIMLVFMVLVMIYPSQSVESAREALELCINVVVPSLFVFMVISGALIRLGFSNLLARPLEGVMGRLFGVSGQGAICFVLGVMSGYPIGAVCVRDMLLENRLSRADAQKLLGFCNNSGPLFILGAVGATMYQSRSIGFFLYIIHIISAVLVGAVIGRFNRHATERGGVRSVVSPPLTVCLTDATKSAVSSMALVCAFTVVFAVVIELFLAPFGVRRVFGAFFEISTGLRDISQSEYSFNEKLIMSAFFLGFGGIGVHMQVAAIIRNTPLRFSLYIFCKLLQGLFSALITAVSLCFFADKLTTPVLSWYIYSQSPTFSDVLAQSLLYIAISAVLICIICIFGMLTKQRK